MIRRRILCSIALSALLLVPAAVAGRSNQAEPPAVPKPIGGTLPAIAITEFQRDGDRWTCRADGRPLSGFIAMPEGKGPFPAILISHGMGASAAQFGRMKAREFVRWGFVCIATDYTHARPGGPGDGRPPAPGERPVRRTDSSDFGASAENIWRARACLAVLRTLPEVDGKRLCAYGNSMGAFLTVGLAAAEPDALKAAAITAGGVVEQEGFPAPSTVRAAKIRTPFLLLHGSRDQTVPASRSALLETTLKDRKTPCERKVFDGIGHGLHMEKAEEVNRLMREWFTRHGALMPVSAADPGRI
jgi:dienelactone hydrolase